MQGDPRSRGNATAWRGRILPVDVRGGRPPRRARATTRAPGRSRPRRPDRWPRGAAIGRATRVWGTALALVLVATGSWGWPAAAEAAGTGGSRTVPSVDAGSASSPTEAAAAAFGTTAGRYRPAAEGAASVLGTLGNTLSQVGRTVTDVVRPGAQPPAEASQGDAPPSSGSSAATEGRDASPRSAGPLTGAVEGLHGALQGVVGTVAGEAAGSLVNRTTGTLTGALDGGLRAVEGVLGGVVGGSPIARPDRGGRAGGGSGGPRLNLELGDGHLEVGLGGGLRVRRGDDAGGGAGGQPGGDGATRIELPTGIVTGLVCDILTGLPIPGAAVSVADDGGIDLGLVKTDLGGRFALEIGRPDDGRLTVSADAAGYADATVGPLAIGPDGVATVKVCLEPTRTPPGSPPDDGSGGGGTPPGGPGGDDRPGDQGPGTQPGETPGSDADRREPGPGTTPGTDGEDAGAGAPADDHRGRRGELPFTGGNGLAFLVAGGLLAGAGWTVHRWARKGGGICR